MPPLKYPISLLAILFSLVVKAQTQPLYTYQQLSKTFYAKQKDSLKKNWACPDAFKNKTTQKKYKEIWDSRTDFITSAIENQNYIYDPEVFNYIQSIINEIVDANPQRFTAKPFLLIDRSSVANAYAIGGNIIAVNIGLIDFAQSREEIALAIAHELSHNLLNHVENVMKEQAGWLTSDEFKNSLNAVLDSKYERFSRLKKLLENYSFNRSKHQRYHESDADSLAVVLLKNSKISFDASFFLRLDSADLQYKQSLRKPLKDYFITYNLPFEEAWTQKRSKGLSTRNYNFKDTSYIQDSLRTHPDCPERYNKTVALTDINALKTKIPETLRTKVNKILIWNMYDNMQLTACLYRIMLEKDKEVPDNWYDFIVYNIFNVLYYSDKQLHRFTAIGITPKEYISKDYYAMQNMLEQMPEESLNKYCNSLQNAPFWQSMSSDEKALKTLMYTLVLSPDDSDKVKWNAAGNFLDDNSNSMYCEFAEHFKKK